MNLRQAAQRALKAMEDGEDRADMIEFSDALIALRAALAEPEQEPVAWEQFYPDIGKPQTTHWEGCEAVHPECKTELERKSNAIQRLWKERDELRSLNAELVEALRDLLDDTQHAEHKDCDEGPCPVRTARAALAKARASNGS